MDDDRRMPGNCACGTAGAASPARAPGHAKKQQIARDRAVGFFGEAVFQIY